MEKASEWLVDFRKGLGICQANKQEKQSLKVLTKCPEV